MAVQPDKSRSKEEVESNSSGHLTATLPAWNYYSQDFFEAEKQKIFLSSWQLVGHISDLPEPGCYTTFQLYEERAFVIRANDGEIRAFHNVCRHRAHILLDDGQGKCPGKVVCPYHGWTYNLDGERTAMGHPKSFP
ncbi:MAG: Rieske (2Fe-2S) protein, partial [Pseudomonadales bacterium]|nr:Rieske (2Fe-2S) protein [Pseudomonadales bacterium]